MQIKTSTVTHVTHTRETRLRTTPMTPDRGRGLHYMPDNDELAVKEARRLVEPAIAALRQKVKNPEAPVEWHIVARDGALWVVATTREVKRS